MSPVPGAWSQTFPFSSCLFNKHVIIRVHPCSSCFAPHTPNTPHSHIPTITLLQELLRLLEEEEVRANALNAAQQELQTKYRGALQEVATVRANVRQKIHYIFSVGSYE